MLVKFRSTRTIPRTQTLALQSEIAVRIAVLRYADQITSIEIHVSDAHGPLQVGAAVNACRLEARMTGRPPIAVHHMASSLALSVDGAADKLKHAVADVVGRATDPRRHAPP